MSKTLKLVIAALMASMACVATMVIKIPIPATGGYINLGDSIVLLSGVVLGPLYGGLAAGAIPGNAIQGTAGIVIATMLMPILGKLNLSLLRKDKPVPKRRNDEQ